MMTILTCPLPACAKSARRPLRPARSQTAGRELPKRIHETLLGRQTFAIAQSLAKSQYWTPDRIENLQLNKLRRLLDHASRHCPYYSALKLPPSHSIKTIGDTALLPLLRRADLRRHAAQMTWQRMPLKKMPDQTRGTTDTPITYYWDRHRQAWDKANRMRGHGWHGLGPGDRELHLWPYDPPVSMGGRIRQWLRERRDELFGELQIDSLHAWPEHLALNWKRWRQFDPRRVTVYPSALAEFVRAGRQAGCRMGNRSLGYLFLTGEVTFPWQTELIENHLRATIVQNYGLQEVGALAFACEFGSWHISAESALIEILRNGHPAAEGELGEVVVTGLESRAMPIIRYCTGDIVRGGPRFCRCGRTLPVMPPVLGRSADFLQSADGRWIEPARVVATLGDVLEEGSFQVLQDLRGGVEVRVIRTHGDNHRKRNEVIDRIRHLLGEVVACKVTAVSALQRSIYGKCRYVHSERTGGGLAIMNGLI